MNANAARTDAILALAIALDGVELDVPTPDSIFATIDRLCLLTFDDLGCISRAIGMGLPKLSRTKRGRAHDIAKALFSYAYKVRLEVAALA